MLVLTILIPVVGNASGLVPDDTRLNNQHLDTTRNIAIYGYVREGKTSSTINKFTFTPQVIINVLDEKFAPDIMAAANQRDSTKNIKKFVQQIVIKTLNKLPGRSSAERKAILIKALQRIAHPVEVDVRGAGALDFNANKESPPTDSMSETAAARFYNAIKNSLSYTPPTLPASVTEIINMSTDLFENGVFEYVGEDTDYSNIQAITEAELNSSTRRPNFKTFLQFLKFLGIVPVDPLALKNSLFASAAIPSRSGTVSVTPQKTAGSATTMTPTKSRGGAGTPQSTASKSTVVNSPGNSIFDDE